MRTLIATVTFLMANMIMAQSNGAGQIGQLLGAGNAKELSAHFTSNVDLTVLSTDDVYSRAQAEQILRKFFQENPPSAFKKEHDGKTKAGDSYVIGTLVTSNGSFRTTYFLKQVEVSLRVKQLRIEQIRDELR